jgi:hypothetical protein
MHLQVRPRQGGAEEGGVVKILKSSQGFLDRTGFAKYFQ